MAIFSVVILTAAPPGMGAEAGGAYTKIDGREALLRSVELFLNRDNVKGVQVIFPSDFVEEAKQKYGGHFGFAGVKVTGGPSRWVEQIAAGVEKLSAEATHVIVHDAARPIVPFSDIDALLEAAEKHSAVTLASPSRSVLVEVDEGCNAVAYHPPGQYMQLLTPQVFTREKFLEIAKNKRETHPSEVTILKGSPLNVRIGGPGDATIAKAFVHLLPKPKVKAASPFEEAQW